MSRYSIFDTYRPPAPEPKTGLLIRLGRAIKWIGLAVFAVLVIFTVARDGLGL